MYPLRQRTKLITTLRGHLRRCEILDESKLGNVSGTESCDADENADTLPTGHDGHPPKPHAQDAPTEPATKHSLPSRPPNLVNELQRRLADAREDLDEVRGVLPEAVGVLAAPRTKRGLEGRRPMTAKARAELERADQHRLREIVMKCMRRVWEQWQKNNKCL